MSVFFVFDRQAGQKTQQSHWQSVMEQQTLHNHHYCLQHNHHRSCSKRRGLAVSIKVCTAAERGGLTRTLSGLAWLGQPKSSRLSRLPSYSRKVRYRFLKNSTCLFLTRSFLGEFQWITWDGSRFTLQSAAHIHKRSRVLPQSAEVFLRTEFGATRKSESHRKKSHNFVIFYEEINETGKYIPQHFFLREEAISPKFV